MTSETSKAESPDVVATVALIRHPERMESAWLAKKSECNGHFEFAVAEQLEHETLKECTEREIGWVFQLRRGKDFLVSSTARRHINVLLHSEDGDRVGHIAFIVADLFGKTAYETIERAHDMRWLSNEELLRGTADDGTAIDPWLVSLLRQADVIRDRS